MKNLAKLFIGAICAAGLSSGALAISINDPGVVGTVTDGAPSDIAAEVIYMNTMLGLGANANQTIGGELYKTSSTDYNGVVNGTGAVKLNSTDAGFSLTVSGSTYVLAKYDGLSGGSVVWYVGGGTINLPSNSAGLWENPAHQGYGISHWTGFGPANPPSVPDAGSSLALLGLAMTGIGLVRRKLHQTGS